MLWPCCLCAGECLVVGQSHFKTFDNKFFTFTGRCQYLLARDCTDNAFSVIIENVQVMHVYFETAKHFLKCALLLHKIKWEFISVTFLPLAACHLQYFGCWYWLVFQCADDQDAVCTRSVTLSLPSLEDMTVKLKHGGVVSVNSMDIQTPMHHGMSLWQWIKSAFYSPSVYIVLYVVWYW